MDTLEQLTRLSDLKDKGILSEEEFDIQKRRLLGKESFTTNGQGQSDLGVGLSHSNMNAIGHVATKTNVLSIIAITLAVMGFFNGLTFIPAIVCGHIALSNFRKDPSIGGEGMARAALIMSYIVVLAVVAILGIIFIGIILNQALNS